VPCSERKAKMAYQRWTCCICRKEVVSHWPDDKPPPENLGHDAEPVNSDKESCCDFCFVEKVIPARVAIQKLVQEQMDGTLTVH